MKFNKNKAALVYIIINTVNGNHYIGVTGRTVTKRWREHCSAARVERQEPLYRAIRKYGEGSFEHLILKKYSSVYEALLGEISFIASLKPRYNITLGGGGRLGVGLSEKGRNKIIQTHTGNKYRLGKPHTKEVKELLRAKANTQKEKGRWKVYGALGPKTQERKVICLDDGQEFPSMSSAAASYKVSKSALIELCRGQRGRQTVGGYRFVYSETTH